jgi:hypothetical protein
MRNTIALFLFIGAICSPLLAGDGPAPEIDSTSAAAAIGLIGGAVMLIRSRKKKERHEDA